VADHLEIERKFEADASFTLPSLTGLPGVESVAPPEVFHLEATYFDTADLALHRNRVTLRRRTGGPDEGWHLKLPVSTDTRRELHEPLAPSVPPRLSAVVEPFTAGQPLQPIAILRTERTVRRLTGPLGSALGEVADDRVTAQRLDSGGSLGDSASLDDSASLAWREIEVESADTDVLTAAGQLLTEAGARTARSASKLGHLLGSLELFHSFP
jgi:inorganic triphosphatase YgiF